MGRNAPREARWAVRAVGVGLLATLCAAWLSFGGVHHPSRAVLHGLLATTLALAACWPSSTLARAGRARHAVVASVILLGAGALALVPLPQAMLAFLAPGVIDARPAAGASTLALDPEATVGELCATLLPLGALVAATAWGSARSRRGGLTRWVRAAFVVVGVVAAAHAFAGSGALFGLVPSSVQPPRRFYAPFVHAGHLGTALVLTGPAVLAAALDRDRRRSERLGWGVVAALGAVVLLSTGSSGAVAAATAIGVLSLAWIGGRPAFGLGISAVGAILVVVPLGTATVGSRLVAWSRAVHVAPQFWFAGAGGGNFELAQLPLHVRFDRWAHAHQDYLEWVVEHGLVGIVAAGLAAWWLRAQPSAWPRRAAALSIGVIGVGIHALVDFPLQIPALAIGAAVVWGLRCGAYEARVDVPAGRLRVALIGFAALELAALGWEVRTTLVDRAVHLAHTDPAAAPPPEAFVWRLAPTRPEPTLLAARRAAERGDVEGVRALARQVAEQHPESAAAQRSAAVLLARAGDPDGAEAAFRRSENRYPGDWRTWVAHARVARTVSAWQAAFAAGAPAQFLDDARAVQPEGLVWVEAAASREPQFGEQVAARLAQAGDVPSALLAYEQARLSSAGAVPALGYIQLLLREGLLDDAESLLAVGRSARPADVDLQIAEARLLEGRGQWSAAADRYLALARQRPALVLDAMRAHEQATGARAAVAALDGYELTARAPALAVLERARLYRDLGDRAKCSADVVRSGLLDDPRYATRARQLRSVCAGSP